MVELPLAILLWVLVAAVAALTCATVIGLRQNVRDRRANEQDQAHRSSMLG